MVVDSNGDSFISSGRTSSSDDSDSEVVLIEVVLEVRMVKVVVNT